MICQSVRETKRESEGEREKEREGECERETGVIPMRSLSFFCQRREGSPGEEKVLRHRLTGRLFTLLSLSHFLSALPALFILMAS